ncbi:replication-associated protein [Trifolium-associated circular DNA virus 1]|uniref:Replication-associated protein n=1 Tax=Trifolium-associated circular DNA virus 1 TaxID=1590173 RepID=A0A0B4U8Q6_9VIRU|nr:replication-associated protein [Trifolium-associated circular DNA virus 1]AJC52531.1 replication-associated protein [Trifolium-associated circular DNA virus 1]
MSQFIIDEASADNDDFADQHDLPTVAQATAKSVRWSAKKFLLTYSQCCEDPDDIFAKINVLREVERAVGCIELHQDGNPHVHIAVEFKKKLNTTNCRFFDYSFDADCTNYHPNVTVADSWPKCINYCRGKNKTLIELYHAAEGGKKKYDLFAVAAGFADNQRAWTQWCYEHDVSPLWKSDVWRQLRTPVGVSSRDEPMELDAVRPTTIDPRFAFMVLPEHFRQSVVLLGPSNCGKTTWAVNHMVERFGKILVVNEIDDLRRLDATHKGIVFDEIRFTGDLSTGKGKWPLHSQIAVVDNALGRSIHCRNINAWIPKGTPKLFTCTEKFCFTYNYQVWRRLNIINLYPEPEENFWIH